MNVSAAQRGRKWPYCRFFRWQSAIASTVILLVLAASGAPAWARRAPHRDIAPTLSGKIPLPQPRPVEAPNGEEKAAPAEEAAPAAPDKGTQQEAAKPAQPDKPAAPPQSACRIALTEAIAIAPSIPPIRGPGACGGEDLVRLETIVLPNKHKVAVTPPATLRCTMATAIADWVRTDVVAIAGRLGSEPAGLDNYASYECRGFNRIPGAHLSEHGRANALDVRAIKLADGRSITLTDRTVPREVREEVLHSVCARFVTVLGPDSDWYHEEHIHLDLAERHNNYRICQWDVLDPLPKVAPLLPATRPDEAPPRKVAKGDEKDGKDNADGAETRDKTAPADKAAQPDAAATAPSDADASGEDESKPATAASRTSNKKSSIKRTKQARHRSE
jgi:hypothetical protein